MITGWKLFISNCKKPQWTHNVAYNCKICGGWHPLLPLPYYPAFLPRKLASKIYYSAQEKLGYPHCHFSRPDDKSPLSWTKDLPKSTPNRKGEKMMERTNCDETRSIHCSTKEYPVAALIISYQTYGSGDKAGADYLIKLDNLEKAIADGFGDDLLIMLVALGEQILRYKRGEQKAENQAMNPTNS